MGGYFSNFSERKEAIISLVVFFDLFDYPLTAYEIWQRTGRRWALSEIDAYLAKDLALDLDNHLGFYCLPGRKDIIAVRQRRYNYSLSKVAKARRFALIARFLPFVHSISVANSIGAYNFRLESDIDLFVTSFPKRIWLARLFLAGIAKLLSLRPTPENKRDKICLSFYAASNFHGWEALKLAGGDPYFDCWQADLIPIYKKRKKPAVAHISWLDRAEEAAKAWQMKIMAPALKQAMNNSDGVVIGEGVIKLYLRDRRREFLDKLIIKTNALLSQA